MLEFIEESHKYLLNGVEIPSVSKICEVAYPATEFRADIMRMEWGTHIHEITAECDLSLDESEYYDNCTEEEKPYLDAWRLFKSDFEVKFSETDIEIRLAEEKLKFAGTIDRISDDYVIDIKTGSPYKWHQLQLTGYDILSEKLNTKPRKLLGVYLNKKGKYKVKEYEGDQITFMACLYVLEWRKANGY